MERECHWASPCLPTPSLQVCKGRLQGRQALTQHPPPTKLGTGLCGKGASPRSKGKGNKGAWNRIPIDPTNPVPVQKEKQREKESVSFLLPSSCSRYAGQAGVCMGISQAGMEEAEKRAGRTGRWGMGRW